MACRCVLAEAHVSANLALTSNSVRSEENQMSDDDAVRDGRPAKFVALLPSFVVEDEIGSPGSERQPVTTRVAEFIAQPSSAPSLDMI